MRYLYYTLLFSLLITTLYSSGGYDHGSSTGKGMVQLDFTWNPFNYFEYGQNYFVFGYGITEKFDIHGYYSEHRNYEDGVNSFYYGLFYQFLDTKYLDLSTAIGKRRMMNLSYSHYFFPQLLFNIKLNNNFSIGGSFVNVKKESNPIIFRSKDERITFDIALFLPITKYLINLINVEDVKLGLGIFIPGFSNTINKKDIYPTYSLDMKFNLFD